jgi:Coenzyme F390 synthetase
MTFRKNGSKECNWRKPVLTALFFLSGSKVLACLKDIKRFETFDKKQMRTFQEEMLERLLNHAYAQVPYYRKVFTQYGIVRHGKIYPDRFSEIPLLTKDVIIKHEAYLHAKASVSGRYRNTSGGSTGEPVEILQDANYTDWNNANKIYQTFITGKKLGDPEIKLWGSERDILEGTLGLKERLINFFYNRTFLNAFRASEEDFEKWLMTFNLVRPAYVWAYVDSIVEFAKYVQRNGTFVCPPGCIVTTAGVLTAQARTFVEEMFHAPVYNQYGSREVGSVAIECPYKTGLHICDWSHYVEIVEGRIITTLLTNYTMPLIRYDIGDTGSIADGICPCGRPTSRLASVTGRTTDHFLCRDGTRIHGEFFTHLFYFKQWVRRFKVIQQDYDRIQCFVVTRSDPKPEDLEQIRKSILSVMGQSCVVQFSFCDQIPPSQSGKYLYTECAIK